MLLINMAVKLPVSELSLELYDKDHARDFVQEIYNRLNIISSEIGGEIVDYEAEVNDDDEYKPALPS